MVLNFGPPLAVSRQCAAVSTTLSAMSVPLQNGLTYTELPDRWCSATVAACSGASGAEPP